jgi:hypothetical protein
VRPNETNPKEPNAPHEGSPSLSSSLESEGPSPKLVYQHKRGSSEAHGRFAILALSAIELFKSRNLLIIVITIGLSLGLIDASDVFSLLNLFRTIWLG